MTHEPVVDKLYKIDIQGYCLHSNPLFQEFLLNRNSRVRVYDNPANSEANRRFLTGQQESQYTPFVAYEFSQIIKAILARISDQLTHLDHFLLDRKIYWNLIWQRWFFDVDDIENLQNSIPKKPP